MKKEIILCISIIIIIVIADVITTKITDEKIVNISNKLEVLESKLDGEGKDKSSQKEIEDYARDIRNTWKDDEKVLAYYIEHQELEKVGIEMDSLCSYAKCNDDKEELDSIARLKSLLSYISDKHDLKLNNFF